MEKKCQTAGSLERNSIANVTYLMMLQNNTSLSIKRELIRKQLKKTLFLPRFIKNNYILETYILDLLQLQSGYLVRTGIKSDVWVKILELLIETQGFHMGTIKRVWCLTKNSEFADALAHICRVRLRKWCEKSDEVRSFYHATKPNIDFDVYGDPLDVLKKIHQGTRGAGLNVLDTYDLVRPHVFGIGKKLYVCVTKRPEIPTQTECVFNPYWVPIMNIERETTHAILPAWMLSWLDWFDMNNHNRIMSKNLLLFKALNGNCPYSDVGLVVKML